MSERRYRWNRRRVGTVFLTAFGLVFFGVGVFAAYRTVALLWSWQDARSWVAVEARITSVDLKATGEDTCEAACRYVYEFDGTEFEGDRVGLERGSDNIGDWQRTTYERLKGACEEGRLLTCYVDPDCPGHAVLFRELRPRMLILWLAFTTVFLMIGVGVVAGCVQVLRTDARDARVRARNPRKPWLWDARWSSGMLRSGDRTRVLVLWAVAVLWNVVSWTVVGLVVVDGVLHDGQCWLVIFMIFPILGVRWIVRATRQTIQHFEFGRNYFRLETLPGVIGGKLAGYLVLRGRARRIGTVNVSLRCLRTHTTDRGDDTSTATTTAWEDTKQFDVPSAVEGNRATVAVEFDIPGDQTSTSDSVEWILRVAGSAPGADVNLEFDVPVFRTRSRS